MNITHLFNENWHTDPEQQSMDATRRARLGREREPAGSSAIDARLAANNNARQQYAETGHFWLKQKDTQQHLNDQPYTGKAAANAAALELLKQQPELRGNLVITAYGPGEQQVTEGRVKELDQDLKDRAMSDAEFKKKYSKTRAEVRAAMREKQGMAEGFNGAVSFREMIDVVDQHYPKYYAELSGSDISDKQFERAIVNAYKEIIKKQGVAEGSLEEDKGMTGYNAFKREWRAKHGADAKVPAYDSKEYTSYVYRQNDKKQGVAEAGNKPLEKSHIGTGDTRTPRELKTQMQGASDEFVKSTADKKTGPFHSKVAKMQGKLAKSELRRREQGVAEGFEFQDAYGQGYDDGYEGKGYNSPFPVGSNEDDEYEDGYGSGRLDYNKMNRDLDEQGVAEGREEMVGFHLDSERAYEAVMAKFGHVIDHDEDSGIMYVPERLWPTVEATAYDADGIGAQRDDDLENPEHYGVEEAQYDGGDYYNARQGSEYGRDLNATGSGGPGAGTKRDDIFKGQSRKLPADPFSRTTGEVPYADPGRVHRLAQPDEMDENEKIGNMDADRFDAAMARLKQLAGAGPMRTVYDPEKRVYKNVPVAQQPGDKK